MTLLTHLPGKTTSAAADSLATINFTANLAALARTQPALKDSVLNASTDLIWTFARDGSLSAMDIAGQWWGGCSLPLLASRAVLKSLESNGQTSCFLAPIHAGLLLAARERMGEDPALLAIVPELLTLRVILSCHDFSTDILTHHLWFVAGESWPQNLRQLFEEQPGLPTPARFIKTKLTTDETIDPMIGEAQHIFSVVLADRTTALESIRSHWPTTKRDGTLLIAGSRFRLWDDAGAVLHQKLSHLSNLHRFDCDDPASSSPGALAAAALSCDTIVAANISRGDAPNLVSPETRWITWLTRPQIPSVSAAGPRDVVILADATWQSSAIAVGWSADRLTIAGWPHINLPENKTSKPTLAILADTKLIEIPKSVEDLSSHRLLWDHIEAELHQNPFAMDHVDQYLDDRSRQYTIDPQSLDRRTFIENLIIPAYQQGLARALLSADLTLQLHGQGWSQLDEFRTQSAGPLTNSQSFIAAASAAKSFIYVWPVRHAHPIDALGKPVITPHGHRPESFLREAKSSLQACLPKQKPQDDLLSQALKFLLS